MLKPLPIGNATFRHIIEGGFLYIDKTRYIYELIRPYKGVYFLARPRRFGKSLMLSTLEEVFRGNKHLFKGLWIDENGDYDWPIHPVIRLDLGRKQITSAAELEKYLDFQIQLIAKDNNVDLLGYDAETHLQDLIRHLAKENRVVILIDEYDKPILDNITELDDAEEIRKVLKGFYGVIKAMDAYIRFVFITGVSKFSKVSVFSDLNNLLDLTMQTAMGTSLGLTEAEIRENLQSHIQQFAEEQSVASEAFIDKIRFWYNGFCFAPNAVNVYNPFSTLLLFQNQRFSNYWFETGTPTFLINLIHKGDYDIADFEDLYVNEMAFSTYELKRLAIIPLMFQTGYLTIKDYDSETLFYTLSYPNYEVENAFLVYLLDAFSNVEQGLSVSYLQRLIDALQKHDLSLFFERLRALYANIDYDLHINKEKYYQTIFYLVFKLIGLQIDAEVKTNKGRIDAVIELADSIYIFEFKIDQNATVALEQIETNAYYQKYQERNKTITQVGANFDRNERNVTDWKSAEVM